MNVKQMADFMPEWAHVLPANILHISSFINFKLYVQKMREKKKRDEQLIFRGFRQLFDFIESILLGSREKIINMSNHLLRKFYVLRSKTITVDFSDFVK